MTPRFTRLSQNWVYGGTLAALILLILTPILTRGWPLPEILAFLCLPVYMLHQYEEHDADRFRLFVGQITGTPDALTIADVFWINIIGVWGVMVSILWLTLTVDQGWGVMAAWFLLINGAGHAAQGLALRRPNPGLWTALLLFLPLGFATLVTTQASTAQHLVSVATILALHGAIVLRVLQNRRTRK